jgi:hypothetical protein
MVGHAIRRLQAATQILSQHSLLPAIELPMGGPEHSGCMGTWQSMRQKLKSLFCELNRLQVQAGYVPAGPGKALNIAKCHRIILYCDHHNGYGRRLGNNGCHRSLVVCEYDIDFSTNELLNRPRIAFSLLFRVDEIQTKVLTFEISKLV